MSSEYPKYPKTILARIANPGGTDEYLVTGDVNDVADEHFENGVHSKVARYVLAGVGEIHQTAPRYVEDA